MLSSGASTTREYKKGDDRNENCGDGGKCGILGISQRENFMTDYKKKKRVKNSCSVMNKIISAYKIGIKMFQAKVQVSFTNSI